jgi:hypothetical protein
MTSECLLGGVATNSKPVVLVVRSYHPINSLVLLIDQLFSQPSFIEITPPRGPLLWAGDTG